MIIGKNIDEIISGIPSKRVRKNGDQIRAAIIIGLDQIQVFLIRSRLDTIDSLTQKLDEIELEIKLKVTGRKDDLKIDWPRIRKKRSAADGRA